MTKKPSPAERGVPFQVSQALFQLGRILSTPGALAACSPEQLAACLALHVTGDWGVLEPEDKEQNQEALFNDSRILSAYPIDPSEPCAGFGDNCLWVITEADRSVTTFLLPDEY